MRPRTIRIHMKTVLILGAGASRATRPKAPLSTRPPLDADFFDIASSVDRRKADEVLDSLRSLVGDYAETLSKSLETATSYLYLKAIDSPAGSPYHAAFLALLSLLRTVLAATTNPASVGPRSLLYRFILSELRNVPAPEDLTIITFNYDLLIERTLESIANHRRPGTFFFPGCYRISDIGRTTRVTGEPQFATNEHDFRGVAVLKLHGSISWHSNHTSDTPTPSALVNPARELHVVDSTKVSPHLTWRRNARRVYMKPIIIPPVSGKRGMMHRKVLPLWQRAGVALQEAERVVIVGYSCPPLDLEARILLSENLRANRQKRVYVIDPAPAAGVKFIDLCGVDHMTIYTSIENWIRDARP